MPGCTALQGRPAAALHDTLRIHPAAQLRHPCQLLPASPGCAAQRCRLPTILLSKPLLLLKVLLLLPQREGWCAAPAATAEAAALHFLLSS